MTLLDELSGFEFEAVMVEVFRHQGYSDVERAELIADEGRDVTMIDDRERAGGGGPATGPPTAVVVECKHTDVVSRPVVQKTHSAAETYEHDGPVRATIATTGRFTEPAREYAEQVGDDPDSVDFELIDGEDLRALSEEIPLDLYNGRIEIVCEEAIRPPTERTVLEEHLEDAAAHVRNLDEWTIGATLTAVRFEPVVAAEGSVDATFETDAGVVHEIDETERAILDGHLDEPESCAADLADLVEETRNDRIAIDDHALDGTYDRTDIERFHRDRRGYREWIVSDLRDRHEATVSYTGDNDVTYERACRPAAGDVGIESLDPVYLPHVAIATSLGDYEYELELYAAGGETLIRDAEFDRCVHCDDGDDSGDHHDRGDGEADDGTHPADASSDSDNGRPPSLTYCANCGAIACPDHVETERLVGDPVCTGCAVTGRFAGATRYFYDETNRETFAETYGELPIYRRAFENEALVALLVLVGFLLAIAAGGLL
jgi:restriction endonuclease Mrr